MDEGYTIRVKIRGQEDYIDIDGCVKYEWKGEANALVITKNNYHIIFNLSDVVFVGKKSDIYRVCNLAET